MPSQLLFKACGDFSCMYLLLRGISSPPPRALLCAAALAKVMKLPRDRENTNQHPSTPPRVAMEDLNSAWSLCGTARKVTSLCHLLGYSSMESGVSGVREEEAGAEMLQKQEQSARKTTGVGHGLIEIGRTRQEK